MKAKKTKQDIRIKKNGNSYQVFLHDEYIGSISKNELCQYILEKRRVGTGTEMAQGTFIKKAP